ncbi:lipopolysaccharide transport periplasmic protein LptA [Marinobacter halotolerans]|uniref:lipopolysaccharide transport periplasmic protein LptA n=1 Tax=Marinobacter halotolerans TaxID=1569211 RepID=UPI0012479E38|nr:lipopolysaccharide transport periplasmic protein LptA [Marinobacter halotolerans]
MSPVNRHTRRNPGILFYLVLMLLAPPVAAFNLESDTPIRVTADTARLDDSKGVATYTGSVEMTQGDIRLTAERVTVTRSEEGVSRIQASGQPARYRQPAVEGQGETDARALEIQWSAEDNRVTFRGEAVIEQGGNLFRGQVIHYDSAERIVTAEGSDESGGGDGRVEMVIQPRSTDKKGPDGSSESQ